VGGLGRGRLSWDDVELWGVEECVDRRLLDSDSRPVGVDVAGEAPAVGSRPGEGGWEVSHAAEGFLPAAEVGQDPWRRKYRRLGMVTIGPSSTEGGT
jgi:hypothetical protein